MNLTALMACKKIMSNLYCYNHILKLMNNKFENHILKLMNIKFEDKMKKNFLILHSRFTIKSIPLLVGVFNMCFEYLESWYTNKEKRMSSLKMSWELYWPWCWTFVPFQVFFWYMYVAWNYNTLKCQDWISQSKSWFNVYFIINQFIYSFKYHKINKS